ncbi:MAG: NUDIX domain-containing protein [Candidatus Komeilibacteria bacterium]
MEPRVDDIKVSVAFLCHDGKGSFLLHLRSDKNRDEHNTWEAGAGEMEFGETPEQALIREVKEEYGCSIKQYSFLKQFDYIQQDKSQLIHWSAMIYVVLVDPAEVKVMEPKKNLQNGWFTFNTLPQPLHSAVDFVLKNCRPELEKMLKL